MTETRAYGRRLHPSISLKLQEGATKFKEAPLLGTNGRNKVAKMNLWSRYPIKVVVEENLVFVDAAIWPHGTGAHPQLQLACATVGSRSA